MSFLKSLGGEVIFDVFFEIGENKEKGIGG